MEENRKYLNKKEMEELLPDYLFGRLPSDEAEQFEESLPLYPDIQKELADARAVFDRVDKIDFSSVIENRAKNISYKVNEKLGKDKYGVKIFGFSPRLIAPVLGLVAVIVVLIFTADNNPFNPNPATLNYDKKKLSLLTPKDAIIIIGTDSTITSDELAELTSDQISSFRHELETTLAEDENSQVSDIFNDIWLESFGNLLNGNASDLDKLSGIGTDGSELLEYLDENDFQELIKVIQNEKFPS
jgi:hypothetical protein